MEIIGTVFKSCPLAGFNFRGAENCGSCCQKIDYSVVSSATESLLLLQDEKMSYQYMATDG
jgi:hypothetical protein